MINYRLGMASYIYSLDSSTTFNYLVFAASAFGEHSLVSSVGVAQSIIGAFRPNPDPEAIALTHGIYCAFIFPLSVVYVLALSLREWDNVISPQRTLSYRIKLSDSRYWKTGDSKSRGCYFSRICVSRCPSVQFHSSEACCSLKQFAVVFYVIGYVVIASSQGIGSIFAGIVIYALYVVQILAMFYCPLTV